MALFLLDYFTNWSIQCNGHLKIIKIIRNFFKIKLFVNRFSF